MFNDIDMNLQANEATKRNKAMMRKALAQRHIEMLEHQLLELDTQKNDLHDQVLKQTDETYLIVSIDERKENLLSELEKYRAILKEP